MNALEEFVITSAICGLILTFTGFAVFGAFLRRASAATQNYFWRALACALVLTPILPWMPTLWQWPNGKDARNSAEVLNKIVVSPTSTIVEVESVPLADDRTAVERDGNVSVTPSMTAAVAIVWAAGFLIVMARAAMSFLRLAKLRKACRSCAHGGWVRDAKKIASELKLESPFKLLECTSIRLPCAVGIFRREVVLPARVLEIAATERLMILRHELAHVKRRDAWFHLVRVLACALHWFNPLVWLAARQLTLSEERAVDDAVIRGGCPPVGYSEMLARFASEGRVLPEAALAMARASTLRRRLTCLLDPKQKRSEPKRVFKTFLWLGLASVFFLSGSVGGQEAKPHPSPVQPSADEATVLVFAVDPDRWAKASMGLDGDPLTAKEVLKQAGLSLDGSHAAIYDRELSRVLVQTTQRHAGDVKAYFAENFDAYPRSSFRVKLTCEFAKFIKAEAPERFEWLTDQKQLGLVGILREKEKAIVFEREAAEISVAPDVLTHSGQKAFFEVVSTKEQVETIARQIVVRPTVNGSRVRLEVSLGEVGQERNVTTTVTIENQSAVAFVTEAGEDATTLAFLSATIIQPAFVSDSE